MDEFDLSFIMFRCNINNADEIRESLAGLLNPCVVGEKDAKRNAKRFQEEIIKMGTEIARGDPEVAGGARITTIRTGHELYEWRNSLNKKFIKMEFVIPSGSLEVKVNLDLVNLTRLLNAVNF